RRYREWPRPRPSASHAATACLEVGPGSCRGPNVYPSLGPLNDGIRHNTVNANHCQQQREPGESPNGGPVESGISKDFIQPLLHGLHAEYRNLRIQGLDSVADRSEVIFRPAIDAHHERREEAAGSCRWNETPDYFPSNKVIPQ